MLLALWVDSQPRCDAEMWCLGSMHSYRMIWMQAQQNRKSVSWLIQLPGIRDNPGVVPTLFLVSHFPLSPLLHHLWLVHRRKSPWTPFSLWVHWIWFERNSSHYSPSIIYILIIAPNSCPPLWKRYSNSFSCASLAKHHVLQGHSKSKTFSEDLKGLCISSAGNRKPDGSPKNVFFYLLSLDMIALTTHQLPKVQSQVIKVQG